MPCCLERYFAGRVECLNLMAVTICPRLGDKFYGCCIETGSSDTYSGSDIGI